MSSTIKPLPAHAGAVRDALLAYRAPPPMRTKPGPPTLSRDWEGDHRFLELHPHAFLFGVIFDRQVEANVAWAAPQQLAERLGHLDIGRLALMNPATLAQVIKGKPGQKSLHRLTGAMGKSIVSASVRIRDEYGGDAANIWKWNPGAAEVIRRLLAFHGIGPKLAHMAARQLVANYGVVLSGWEDIDVAVDRHVARVFLRTGLVGHVPRRTSYTTAELKDDIVAAARALHPSFPGALDEGAFTVGRDWCTAERAWCADGRKACPLLGVCPKRRTTWAIG